MTRVGVQRHRKKNPSGKTFIIYIIILKINCSWDLLSKFEFRVILLLNNKTYYDGSTGIHCNISLYQIEVTLEG